MTDSAEEHPPATGARLAPPPGPIDGIEGYRLPDGRPLALFEVLAHHPPALADLRAATARSLQATSLPLRLREILILRVLMRWDAAAEAQVHVAMFGRAAGLDSAVLADLARSRPSGLAADDALMVRVADAVADGGALDDESWAALRAARGEAGAVDAIFVAAQYLKVAAMNNALAVTAPFPSLAEALDGGRYENTTV